MRYLARLLSLLAVAFVGTASAASFIDPSVASAVTQVETDAGTLVGYLTAIGMIVVGAFWVWGVFKKILGKAK